MGRVFYATNRNPDNTANPTSFGIDFNGTQPGALTFGVADVSAPSGHDPQGLPYEASGPGDVQLSQGQAGDFSAAAKQMILAGPPHLVVSVHGFQYLFWEAITRADYVSRWFAEGQFANPNTIIAFTWPSAGVFSEYQRDWTYSTNSAGALAAALTTLKPLIDAFRAAHGQAARVTLLAHSMGNHMLDVGLGALSVAAPPVYNRIILAAADESRNQMAPNNNLAKAQILADRVYVYYNNQDMALAASALVEHGFEDVRLGVDGPPNKDDFKNTNVTFMNASAAGVGPTTPENSYDSEGHQYYRMIQEVRNDICAVMRGMADSAIPNRIYRDDPHYGWENYWRIDTMTVPAAPPQFPQSSSRNR
ncbi:MAG TPA: alpha/beta hydrolase [Dongiaceae bacterium]|nr:alpha/beta hydrolase [Dongiaceae bacterium]